MNQFAEQRFPSGISLNNSFLSEMSNDDLFKDPPNYEDLMVGLKNASSPEEIQNIILTTFPGWIRTQMDCYSPDYDFLQRNWNKVTTMTRSSMKKILLVERLQLDANHKLITLFAELMTNAGYCVRQVSEFGACPVCTRAIPFEALWIRLKERNLPVPARWSNTCSGCQ